MHYALQIAHKYISTNLKINNTYYEGRLYLTYVKLTFSKLIFFLFDGVFKEMEQVSVQLTY